MIAASSRLGKKVNGESPTKTVMQKKYADKFLQVMRPESLGRLARRKQGRARCELEVFFQDKKLDTKIGFATFSKSEVQVSQLPRGWHEKAPVFIPTRELLTLYPGFISVYDQHYLEFDETYRDTCLLLGSPALKGPRESKARELLKPLEEVMGGRVVLDKNGRFYLSVKGEGNFEMPLVAEGMRKLAMLAQLVLNGSLLDRSFLFWDEPEANLNPKIQKVLAKVVLHLSRNGIQVFLATHSLFLLRELDILSRSASFSDIPQKYFALRLDDEGVEVEQGVSVDDLKTIVSLDEELTQSDRYMDAEEQ